MVLHTMWVPLMLLTALPDMSAACPLILQYPDLVELGKEMNVNCSTSVDGHRGIYFQHGNDINNQTTESYIELAIPRVDLDTKVKCTIRLNDTFECSEDLRLNVYKAVEINETAQENNLLKCDINDLASAQNLTVTWYIGNKTLKTSLNPISALASMKVDSSLEMNVSINDIGSTITCEVRMDLEPQGHVFISNKTWNLSVQDSPKIDKNGVNETKDNKTKEPTKPAPPKISAGCPLTLTPSKIVVQNNKPSSANCSTTEAHNGLGWEATEGGTSTTLNVNKLEWRVQKVTRATEALCFISLKNGTQCTVKLVITVYDIPDKLQVFPVENDRLEEGKLHKLKCNFSNVAPLDKLQVKWYQDDKLIPAQNESELALIPKKEHNKANFTCEIELLLEQEQNPKVVSEPYTANVQYKPHIQDCPTNYAGKEDKFKLDAVPCKANGNPQPVIYWYYKDGLVSSTKPLARNESGTYTATFKNNIGNTSTTVAISIESGPYFTCKEHYNVTENTHVAFTCEPEGIPKPKSVWFKDGKRMDFPNLWKRHHSGQYLIEATNTHGHANHTLNINVLYAPSLSKDVTQEFHMGENLTLNCSADGNPPPQLHWKYPLAANVNKTTRGRHIYITEATSTNAGLYICNATNEIGSVSRTVTLIMKGESHIDYYMILIFVLLAFLLIPCLAVLIYRYRKNKSGHYNVISDSVPLTARSGVN